MSFALRSRFMFALAPYRVLLVHCALMGLNKELRMVWRHLYDTGCLLTLPMFAVFDLTSETRERGSKRGMR